MAKIKLDKILGRGAFGEVWLGDWHGTEVAIKTIHMASDKMKESVLRETGIMQLRLGHCEGHGVLAPSRAPCHAS